MEFSIHCGTEGLSQGVCRVVGIFEGRQLSTTAERFDALSGGAVTALLQQGRLEGQLGQWYPLTIPQLPFEPLLLVGCGKASALTEEQFQKIIKKVVQCLNDTGVSRAIGFFTEWSVKGRDGAWIIRQTVEEVQAALYRFDQLKQDNPKLLRPLKQLMLSVAAPGEVALGEKAIQQALAVANGLKQAKDLANMPPNLCHTAYLATQARQLAARFAPQMSTTVVEATQMQALGMNAYLAVGQGSQHEPLMSIITYDHHADPQAKPIVFVGKGLTFDSGGISLKPGLAMDEMKYDMCGAAAVYGVMQAVAELQLPLKVIGIMAGCENMPGSKAYRPGDILTTLSGQTVEVLNTDAEGRLVLCDVLTYVERFDPEVVIDVATLTGACVVALGHEISGLLSNHEPLAQELLKAAQQANDPLWQLPLAPQYQQQLKSNFADMANIGDRSAGTIVAGCFLSRFTDKYHWAHLDIAGTAWRGGKAKGATGRPVALLLQFLLNRAGMAMEASSSLSS